MQKALAYVQQALGRLTELEDLLARGAAGGMDEAAARATRVSLRRNLESAETELKLDQEV